MIVAVGDIHGRIGLLNALLEQLNDIPMQPEDTLVFIGDYVDRGEDSRAVIETLMRMQQERPNTVCLRGNHEQLMLDARSGPAPEPSMIPGLILHSELTLNWLQNGGVDTLLSYHVENFLKWWEFVPEEHWSFVLETQLEFETDRYLFVHAGILPQWNTWDGTGTPYDPRLWIREPFLSSEDDFGRRVIFGHTPQSSGRPLVMHNKIGIDTGAAYGGPLTAVILKEDESEEPRFIQVAP